MKNLGILDKNDSLLLVIDIQERLMPVINKGEEVVDNANKLIKGAELLEVPVVITEQYPRGLGSTCEEISLPNHPTIIEKICFSGMLSGELKEELERQGRKSLILCGAETHICVFKTALDALNAGYEVHIAADAVSSRKDENKQIALNRLREAGAFIASTEMILFQWLDVAGNDTFKAISKLIK